jgi:hypothetical protein
MALPPRSLAEQVGHREADAQRLHDGAVEVGQERCTFSPAADDVVVGVGLGAQELRRPDGDTGLALRLDQLARARA